MTDDEIFCPSNEFIEGIQKGKCWGCGHYKCKQCKNFREDFIRLGQEYIDFINAPSHMTITII